MAITKRSNNIIATMVIAMVATMIATMINAIVENNGEINWLSWLIPKCYPGIGLFII